MASKTLDLFAQDLRTQGLSDRTVAAYVSDVRRYGGIPRNGVEHIMRSREIRASALAPRTRARHMAAHSKLWEWHMAPAGVATNPYVRPPKMGIVLPRCIPSLEAVRALLDADPSPMYRAIYALMAGAGLRISEVLAVRWLDFVVRDPDPIMTLRVEGKGSKVRDVPIGDEVYRYVAEAYRAHLRSDPRMGLGTAFPVTARTVQRRIKRYGGAALHPHALRHAFATRVYEGTTDLRLVGDLLGHASVSTTAIYTHVSDKRRVEAVSLAL
jgi:site-specific recombinase XerC